MSGSPLSFRIDDAIKVRLERAASEEDRSVSSIAQRALIDFLDRREWRREQILSAFDDAQREQSFISDEAMLAWVDSWGTDAERPVPQADIFLK